MRSLSSFEHLLVTASLLEIELDNALRQRFASHLKVLANRNGAKRGD